MFKCGFFCIILAWRTLNASTLETPILESVMPDLQKKEGPVMRSSYDYSDEAFRMRLVARLEKRKLTLDESGKFADLIISSIYLENSPGLNEAFEYVRNNIENGENILKESKKTSNFDHLKELIIEKESH